MNKNVYFLSDIHLGLESEEKEYEKERKLVSFLEHTKENAGTLYILGDLFDYWFEYRKVIQKGFFRVFTALNDLTDAGVEVRYLIGNHDFLHREFFEKQLGVMIHKDPITVMHGDKKFFLAHGDGLMKNDTGYRILKSILRNKLIQWIYSLIHPDLGIWLASRTSKKSRNYTSKKDYGEQDGLFIAAKEIIDSGFDFVLFGHAHVRKHAKHNNGYYINLGTWLERPCYGHFDGENFNVINWESE